MKCKYCGREGIKQFKNGSWCCNEQRQSCPELTKKQSERMTGDNNPMKSIEVSKKVSMKLTGRKLTKEHRERMSKSLKGKNTWIKEIMLNGGSVYIASFIRNPSKPQVETWRITSKICPYVYLNYPIIHLKNTYSIDIAIPKLEIAIEFDGSYWHQDKEKDLKRQLELEEDGWKFLRYEDKIPTKEQILEDVNRLLDSVQIQNKI